MVVYIVYTIYKLSVIWGDIVLSDAHTMYMMLCLGNFIMFVMLMVFGRVTQSDGIFKRYSYSKLLQGLGISLVLMQGVMPEIISVIAGNGFIIVGIMLETFCLIYVGIRPRDSAARGWIRISLALVAGFTLIYFAGADIAVRSAVISMIAALVMLAVAVGLIFYNNETKLRRITGGFFIAFSIMCGLSAMDALANKAGYPIFNENPGETLTYLMAYGYMLVSTMAFLLMSREALELKLQQAATRDFLTGIYNRGHAMHLAKKLFSLMIRQRKPISVLMIDLDHFKAVNDKYGHFVGDEVLVNFSHKTAALLRSDAVFGRYGGEEFIVFCPNTNEQDAAMIAKRIKGCLVPEFTNKQTLPHYTVSIGAATIIPADIADMAKLMKMADEALFQAKRTGRNKVIQYG